MYHSGTICQRNISVTCHIECFLVLLCSSVRSTLVERLILLAFQVCSLVCLQDLVCRFSFFAQLSENSVKQRARHIVGVSVCRLDFRVILVRVHAERKVRRQRPRRSGPCENICIFVFHLKSYDCRALFYILVALSHFLCGQRRTTARAVGNDLKSFVEKAFLPDLLQRPPLGLDECIVVCHIRMLHISPESDCGGEILPHSFVFPDTFLTFLDERLQTVFLDLILSVQAEFLLDLQFYRETMCVPSGFSRHHTAFHRAVSRDHILDHSGKHVSDMRFSVCCRRSVVENVLGTSLSLFDTLLEDVVFFPEFLDLFLAADKIHIRGYFLVHVDFFLSAGPARSYMPMAGTLSFGMKRSGT